MTEKEIETGLECCTFKACQDGCPYYGETYCKVSLKMAALKTIREQRQKIEELAEQMAIKLQGGCE